MPTPGAIAISPSDFLREFVIPAIPSPEDIYGDIFTTRGGEQWRGRCPLHGGEGSNFSVNRHTLRWNCWSECGKGGDVIAFLNGGTNPTGAEFVTMVRELAERYSVDTSPIDRPMSPEQAKQAEQRRERGELLEDFAALTASLLNGAAAARVRSYLHGRGVAERDGDGEPIDYAELGVGYYPSPDDVLAELSKQGHDAEAVNAAGLTDGRWAGRLLVAMRDDAGRLVSFAARDMSGDADPAQKYLYLKGGTKPAAFGVDRAFRTAPGAGRSVVVAEGLLDVVALRSWGDDHAIATGGNFKLLTAERWGRLLGMAALVRASLLLATDNDDTGAEALRACLDNLRGVERVAPVYVANVADYGEGCKDLGDAFKASEGERPQDAVAALYANAKPWAEALAGMIAEGVTPESPAPEREACALNLSDLIGDAGPLDRGAVLNVATEKTGYEADDIEAAAQIAHERRTRDDKAARVARLGMRLAQGARGSSDPGALDALARETTAELVRITAGRDDDTPERFTLAAQIERMKAAPEGLETGWSELDAAGVRLRSSELTVFAGRTGYGKTCVLVQLLHRWTEDHGGAPFLFVSAEEPADAIARRLLALTMQREALGTWGDGEIAGYYQRGAEALSTSRGKPDPEALRKAEEDIARREPVMQIVYRPGWNVDQLAAYALEFAEEAGGCAGVLVDYLQRIPAGDRGDRRDVEVSAVGRRLKHLAHELGAPVVAGAQINRTGDAKRESLRSKEDDGDWSGALDALRAMRPELHHLREGGVEQEADAIFGLLNHGAELRRDDDGADDPDRCAGYEIGVLKNRHGAPGRWFERLRFNGWARCIENDPHKAARQVAPWEAAR